MNNLRNICYILNLDYHDIKYVFEKMLTTRFDNLIIDLTRPDKKLRINFTKVLSCLDNKYTPPSSKNAFFDDGDDEDSIDQCN